MAGNSGLSGMSAVQPFGIREEEDVWTGWSPVQATTDGGLLPDHWYRANDGPVWKDAAGYIPAIHNGDPVDRWEDKSANADHMNQPTSTKRPTLQLDVLNGRDVLRFDGNDFLCGSFLNGGWIWIPWTAFAVARLYSAQDNADHVLMSSSGVLGSVYQGSIFNPDRWHMYAGNSLSGGAADSAWKLWTILFNGAASQFWHGGVSIASGNAGAVAILTALTIGANGFAGSAGWKGDIAEVIIYAGNISTLDKNEVGQYLSAYYDQAYVDIV